jgi:peptidase M50B-like protein
MESQSEIKSSFRLLLIACAVTIVVWFIPYADLLTYPFRLFITFIHETGHALAALGTFGSVRRVNINWSGSGVTETVGGAAFLIASAGYLSTALYGSSLLLLLRRARNARVAALATAVLIFLITVLFAGNVVAWGAGLLFGAGFVVLALKAKPAVAHFLMSFLAVQAVLNAFYDLRTLMYLSAFQPGVLTDARNMSVATGELLPPIAWAVGWSLVSVGILSATLFVYYRSLRQAALTPAPPVLIADPLLEATTRR